MPRRDATPRQTLDLPEPAGPSTATTASTPEAYESGLPRPDAWYFVGLFRLRKAPQSTRYRGAGGGAARRLRHLTTPVLAIARGTVNALPMFSRLLVDIPPVLLFLVFAACGVAFALIVASLGYNWFLTLVQEPPKPPESVDEGQAATSADVAPAPKVPGPWDLFSRVLTVVSLAFVFILALTLNTFWSNAQDAQTASLNEQNQIVRIISMAKSLSDPANTEALTNAAKAYASDVVENQWPLLEVANRDAAAQLQGQAAEDLGNVVMEIGKAGASDDQIWGEIQSAVVDLGQNSLDRLSNLPDDNAPMVVVLVIVLGLVLIGLTAAWLPTKPVTYRTSLSIMAVIIALLCFMMVQASNPYAQHVKPTGLRGALVDKVTQ